MIKKFKLFEERINLGRKMVLPKDVLNIYQIFKSNNYSLFVVGGATRDFILKQEPHDIDLVSNAKPDEIIDILKNKYRLDLQGKQFGVVRVFTKETPSGIEIASYRTDLAKGRDNKGTNKKVDYENATIETDAERRDLSQNALYYDIETGDIIDLVGGIEDINKNKIKTVGSAYKRFDEDRLRILRIFRFAARNLSKIDFKTARAIKKDNRLSGISPIDDVSRERIMDMENGEFMKAIKWSKSHNKPESFNYYLELLWEYNMFDEIFPGLDININDTITTFNLPILFAILFKNNPTKTLSKILPNLKFSSDLTDSIIFLLRFKNEINDIDKILPLHKERNRIHMQNSTIEEFAEIFDLNGRYVEAFIEFNPRIDAREIMDRGFKGRDIGLEKDRLELEEFKKLL